MNSVNEDVNLGTATLEEKRKWIEALESGDYQQVTGTLKGLHPDGVVGFCCLGVYCDLVGKEMPDEGYEEDEHGCGGEGPKEYYAMTENHLGDFQDKGIDMNDKGIPFINIAQTAREFYGIPHEHLKKGSDK